MRAGGEGNLEAQGRPTCQGRRVNKDLLERVDSIIADLYDAGSGTLWDLNCLVYAGAIVAQRRSSFSCPGAVSNSEDTRRKREAEVTRLRRKVS